MISRLTGIVVEKDNNRVVLDVNGVGYEVFCSLNTIAALQCGEEATLVIHTEVREDSITLFGFADKLEKQTFLLLKTVKGVGARSASDIISRIDKLDLLRIIGSGDTLRLRSVKGIGRKIAERIVVELKEKVSDYAMGYAGLSADVTAEGAFGDALEALRSLGFSQSVAEAALQKVKNNVDITGMDAGKIVQEALQYV
ncbi:MAG: Holliday junction branch migration protein RuvA [Candidatus Dadabacteria bacterium]|nr:MAG: Holliday junction branch migration protein RuvA [Candidatus Dadabacteria bacterium]